MAKLPIRMLGLFGVFQTRGDGALGIAGLPTASVVTSLGRLAPVDSVSTRAMRASAAGIAAGSRMTLALRSKLKS